MRQYFSQIFGFLLLISGFCLVSAFTFSEKEEYGKAGYYADSLHGRKTASGEKYDKNELSCAHKSLPFGTKLRVTRLDNKKSVIVRVNDRGPFSEGYVIDLSRKAAEQIDLIKKGVAKVKVEIMESEGKKSSKFKSIKEEEEDGEEDEKPAASSKKTRLIAKGGSKAAAPVQYSYSSDEDPKPAKNKIEEGRSKKTELYKVNISKTPKKGFGVQMSTLSDANNVLPIIQRLERIWPDKVLVCTGQNDDDELSYRVVIGPFKDKKTALAEQKKASTKGYPKSFLVDLESL